MKLYYFSYPFSDRPASRTEEASRIASEIVQKHSDIFLIVPHLTFNPLWADRNNPERNVRILQAEIEMIRRCDGLMIGVQDLKDLSPGMTWEISFARSMGKPILDINLLELDLREEWFW